MAGANVTSDAVSPVKVSEVCRQFLTSADGVLAQRLQDEEYGAKYQWNKVTRKVARVDVPLAKTVHEQEEERQQRERMEFLQEQQRLAAADERMALQLQQEEQKLTQQEKELLTKKDAEVALQLQRDEERKKEQALNRLEYDDAKIALELQREEILHKDRIRAKREMEDQALARQLQDQERQILEMRTMERQLREERRQLELELLQEATEMQRPQLQLRTGTDNPSLSQNRRQRPSQSRDSVAILGGGSSGFRVAQDDFLSEAEQRNLLQLQDEELARALQEHEEKKARHAHRDIGAEIERRDAQLARIIQEVERLELLKQTGTRRREQQLTTDGDVYIVCPLPPVNAVRSPPAAAADTVRSSGPTLTTNSINSSEYSNLSFTVPAHEEFSPGTGIRGNRLASGEGQSANSSVVSRSTASRSSVSSNETGRLTLSSSGSSSSIPHTPPPPPPPPPLPPLGASAASAAGADTSPYTQVARNRPRESRTVEQTSTTTTYSVVSHDNSRQTLNNKSAFKESRSPPAHYGDSQTKRQNSKDKSCKQQ